MPKTSEFLGMMGPANQYYWRFLPEVVEVVIESPNLEELDYSKISFCPEDPSSDLYEFFLDPRFDYQE